MMEELLTLPHIKQALVDHGNDGLDVSEELVDWVIKQCFNLNRRLQFVEEANESLELCAGLVDGGAKSADAYNAGRQELVDKFATTAAAAYLLGAFAGASGAIGHSTERIQ